MTAGKTIWTIGHSTRSADELLVMLKTFGIELLVDVRSYPGSKRFPQFNRLNLEALLLKNNINYLHLKDLGGGRWAKPDSLNTAFATGGFRGYADHMSTAEYKKAMEQLEAEAGKVKTAYMCAEGQWRNCHRSLLSDDLKARGWKVIHILDNEGKSEEHPYTKEARLVNGLLSYHRPNLFS